MTDTTTPRPDKDEPTGTTRPDQGGTDTPGKEKAKPATGGDGAAGAGGKDGFGTGS